MKCSEIFAPGSACLLTKILELQRHSVSINPAEIELHQDKGTRYLRFWVSGKIGGRWLIARHRAVEALQRLHVRQKDISGMAFEDLLKSRCEKRVFRFTDGYQPPSFIGTFRRLMRDSGLLKGEGGQNRTLYSLRHTYATFALLDWRDIHTLAKSIVLFGGAFWHSWLRLE